LDDQTLSPKSPNLTVSGQSHCEKQIRDNILPGHVTVIFQMFFFQIIAAMCKRTCEVIEKQHLCRLSQARLRIHWKCCSP